MKRILTSFATLLLAVAVHAATETVGGVRYTYTVSDGSAQIYKGFYSAAISTSTTGNLAIPATLGGYPVTGIGDYAFYWCSGLTGVTIPDSVTSIGDYAFYDCFRLTSVTLPDSVASIGDRAFCDCSGLTSVTIGNSVTYIGDCAFKNCDGLTSVHIFDLAAWCKIAFENDFGANPLCCAHNLYLNGELVTDLIIPGSVTNIASFAFQYCRNLTSVTIPDSVTGIGNGAFYRSGLTRVTMRGDAPSVYNFAFKGVSSECIVRLPTGNGTYEVTDGKWQGMTVEWYTAAGTPAIADDEAAEVTGNAEAGFVVKPSEGRKEVVVTIPDGVEAAKVTVVVGTEVSRVAANGAAVRVVSNGRDITEWLDIPAADGVWKVGDARVKEEIVKETMEEAEIELESAEPSITTPATRPGLVYTLCEGVSLQSMSDGDSKVGDGLPWTPAITVRGGEGGSYTIKVTK